MSYTKHDLREAFYAGKLGGITFDSWLLKSKSFDHLVYLYQHCFIKFLDIPSSYGLNIQTLEASRLKTILRGLLRQEIPNLTLDLLCEVELAAGSSVKTDTSTISSSSKRYTEKFQNHYLTIQIRKIIKEENI